MPMPDISLLHSQIEESMARQEEWGTDNFIGGPDGTDLRGMSEDELAQYFAGQLGQGIERQRGNY